MPGGWASTTPRLETLKLGRRSSHVPDPHWRFVQEGGGGEMRPAGHMSHCAGACGAPEALPVVGRRRGGFFPTPRGHTAGSALGSLAQAGRRAGLDAQPERPLMARGAKQKKGHAVTRRRGLHPPGKTTASRSEKNQGNRGEAPGKKIWWCGAPPEGAASFHLAQLLSNRTPPNAIPRKWDIPGPGITCEPELPSKGH